MALINRAVEQAAARPLGHPPGSVRLCSVVKAELHFGAQNSARLSENLQRIEIFCRAFKSLPFDDESARHYGVARAQLGREGRPIGGNDLMIASIAIANSHVLVTPNCPKSSLIGSGATVTAQDSGGTGRANLADLTADRIHLFEFKVFAASKQGAALQELEDRDYAAKHRHLGLPVHLDGVEFNAQTRKVEVFWSAIERPPKPGRTPDGSEGSAMGPNPRQKTRRRTSARFA